MKTKLLSILIMSASVLFATELTFRQALRKAEDGDSDAQWQLAKMYKNGTNGAPHSYEEAIKWYTKAADAGHVKAMGGLGLMYEKGLGVEKSPAKAMRLYLQGAAKGLPDLYAHVGFMYEDGVGVPVSKQKAHSYYLKAAQEGSALGQFNLGRCYAHGIGCESSGAEAVRWLLKAAEQGADMAYDSLGFYYEIGLGVEKSEEKALKYYRKGAELGNDECKKKVAELTAVGKPEYDEWMKSGQHDPAKAWNLLKSSAQKGYEPAQSDLAEILMAEAMRDDDDKKYAEAFVWFRKSAEQGNTQSMKQLSCLYGMGKGCKKSPSEAFYWAEKGSKAGDHICHTLLSDLYSYGIGCDRNEIKAFELALEAAKAENYPDAWYRLGLKYLKGEGTPMSDELGVHWLKKAAKKGHKEADKLLMTLNDAKYTPPSITLGCKIRIHDPVTRAKLGITSVSPCSEPEGSYRVDYTPKNHEAMEKLGKQSWAIVKDGNVISLVDSYTTPFKGNKREAIQKSVGSFSLLLKLRYKIVGSGMPYEVDASPSMKKAKRLLPVGSLIRDRVEKAVEISTMENPQEEIFITLRSSSGTIDTKVSLDIEKNSVTVRVADSLVIDGSNPLMR